MEQTNTGGKDYGLYIDGHYVESWGSARLPVINPATGETWATISDASAQDIEQAVDVARRCFESTWSRTSPGTRARLLSRLAECIERRSAELAEIEVRDNGKLLREMSAQLKSLPGLLTYVTTCASRVRKSLVRYSPSFPSTQKKRPSPSRTIPTSALLLASGQQISRGRIGWRASSPPGPSGSIPTALLPRTCPSGATKRVGLDGKMDSTH